MGSIHRPRTLYEKVFDDHVVAEREDGTVLFYIDRHLIHEVTSPQAFAGLEARGYPVRCPTLTLATSDHNVPTTPRKRPVKTASFLKNPASRLQVQTLESNVRKHNIPYLGLNSSKQGIVHVIGPELGFTLPGNTVVCGDSHTSTHGAFGAIAFGIGTSEVEHVLATQTIVTTRSLNMKIVVEGTLGEGVSSKDLMLYIIGKIGTAGGTGMVIEFAGPAIERLTMESRMAMCNMAIEAGARTGMIAPDDITLQYIKDRPMAPNSDSWDQAAQYWKSLRSDPDAHYEKILEINARDVAPTVTWGTSPEQVVPITGSIPFPEDFQDKVKQESCRQALKYMGLESGTRMMDIAVDKVFIGSCSNARLEDFRIAAQVLKGKIISPNLKLALAVPGSGMVKKAAEAEGLDTIFRNAGFEWREAGCSLCVGLNEDALDPFERCASTSNRNFESRQGTAGRTHLVSPAVAAATAISGKLADVRLEQLSTLIEHEEPKTSDDSGEEFENLTDADSTDNKTSESSSVPKKVANPFNSVEGKVAILNRANIDTDAIFPKQFCTTIQRKGLGDALFYNLRYNEKGERHNSFILNQPEFQDSKFLLATGPNFGCGSSREHAVWALQDFGFKCVLAPSFADIFYNNSFKNGLLPAIISPSAIEIIVSEVNQGKSIEIDLPSQAILNNEGQILATFEIPEHRKEKLLKGLDELETSLLLEKEITAFEKERGQVRPWVEESVSVGQAGYLFASRVGKKILVAEESIDRNLLKW